MERGGLALNPSPPAPNRGDCLIETLEANKMPGLSVLGDTTTDKATERQRQQHPDLRWVLWTNGYPGQTSGPHGLHDQTTRLLLTSVCIHRRLLAAHQLSETFWGQTSPRLSASATWLLDGNVALLDTPQSQVDPAPWTLCPVLMIP